MKNTVTNKLVLTVLLASFVFVSLPASARDDGIPSRAQQQVLKLQQQIKVAEARNQQTDVIKTAACHKLVEQGKKC